MRARSKLCCSAACCTAPALFAQDVWDQVEHRYADSNGVKIHYAVLGEGPLVVMIHGFPDFWYTWRHQMRALADTSTVSPPSICVVTTCRTSPRVSRTTLCRCWSATSPQW